MVPNSRLKTRGALLPPFGALFSESEYILVRFAPLSPLGFFLSWVRLWVKRRKICAAIFKESVPASKQRRHISIRDAEIVQILFEAILRGQNGVGEIAVLVPPLFQAAIGGAFSSSKGFSHGLPDPR